ncbi:MAG: hypothetical protein HOP19_06910 [Acidobacteria bacterium]|nr:hypothetical protein [Acidobacteriota bacterium]
MRTSFLFCLLSLLLAGLPRTVPLPSSQAQAQATPPPLRIPLTVSAERAALPVVIGVPIAESSNVTDATVLGVVNASDEAVPSQMRVLARWRGPVTDASKLVKWVLVDFKPSVAGTYYLTRAAQAVPSNLALVLSTGASSISVKNAQLEAEFSRTGTELIRSFKLGATEMLRAPMTIAAEAPRAALVTRIDSVTTRLNVADASVFRAGDSLRFVFNDTLKWAADLGTKRIVTDSAEYIAGHRYVIDDGTTKREEFVLESIASPQDNRSVAALTKRHEAGAKVRDLTIEAEAATVRSTSDQTVNFTAALTNVHAKGEKLFVVASGQPQSQTGTLTVTETSVEESNALRAVVKQKGYLTVSNQRLFGKLDFVVRYYVYADQPFVRVRVQAVNTGVYGFGAANLNKAPFAQHLLLRSLSAIIPTNATGGSTVQALTATEARTRIQNNQSNNPSGATLSVGSGANAFELGVPEFAENYPKCIKSTASGLRFDLLPDLGASEPEYVFDGARAKTTDFYLGRSVNEAQRLTTGLGAKIDPAHVARTGAVRPAMVEKRDWSQTLSQSAEMAEAGARYEQMMASAYDLASCYGVRPQSMFEYRNSTEFGEQLGWRNFGDLGWGDGYANLHYDLPFILLREYLRTGDARAFQLGNDEARYLANWGQHHGEDFGDTAGNTNFRGMSFYEKGDHGSFGEPKPSHMWIEGMWLHWALTGDATSYESAREGSEAFKRIGFTFDNGLSWNEPRWVGWSILGLMAAWRYTGNMDYLAKARDNTYLFVQAEEAAGRKGYFIATGVDWANKVVQPWAWTGYAQQGPIEFWRETQDQRVAQYLVRVADWYVGNANPDNRPLAGGVLQADGKYLPLATSYFWEPGKTNDDRGVHSGGMGLQVLVAAARITNRSDLWAKASQLFRDTMFFRDLGYGPMTPTTRATISFRSAMFTSSSTKAYGQTALTEHDYLPELLGTVVLPRTGVTIPPSASPTPTPPTFGGGGGSGGGGTVTPPAAANIPPFITGPKTDGLINAALKKPATASSVKGYPDVTGDAASGNDGTVRNGTRISLWHSAVNTGNLEWWQVDLQTAQRLMAFELTFRADIDQVVCRRNFEILGSNDATFATAVILASRGEQPVPFGQPFKVGVSDKNKFRYVRVRKNKVERDASNQQFFNLVEVKAFAYPSAPPQISLETPMASLTNVALNRGTSSSTFHAWDDVTGEDRTANDGLIQVASKSSAWHSESNTGQLEWVQVDLGQPYRLQAVEVLSRQDVDQPLARRNFVVLGSTTEKFDNPVVLAMCDDAPFPFGQNWRANIGNTGLYRYVRVMKTDWDDFDASGQQFFSVAEVRVYADLNVQVPTALTALTDQALKVGQSFSVLIQKTDAQNRALTLTASGIPENAVWDAARGFFSFTPHSGQAGRIFPIFFTGTAAGVAPYTVRMDIVVTFDGTPNVVLTAPTITTAMIAGQPVNVRWAISPGSAMPVRYRVFLSTNSAQTWLLIGEAPANVGNYRWTIPLNYPVGTPLRFMVQALDATNRAGLDYNKQDLRVGPAQTATN